MGKLNEGQCPIDILRLIYNKWQTLSIIILVNGHGQIGKSTFIDYIANRLIHLRDKIPLKDATWQEWDWKKYTTTNPKQFVDLWDKSDGQVLAMEEAGEQMNYLDWYGLMARVFSSTTRTQGLKRNVCFLITPFSKDITKYNREHIDFRVWVMKRDDKRRYCKVRPRYIKINYLKDNYKLGWLRDWHVFYPKKFLPEATKFTNYLKGYKGKVSDKNKEMVGLKQSQYERFCQECRDLGVTPPTISTAKRYGIIK